MRVWQTLTWTFTFLVWIFAISSELSNFSLLGGTSSILRTFLGGTSQKNHPVYGSYEHVTHSYDRFLAVVGYYGYWWCFIKIYCNLHHFAWCMGHTGCLFWLVPPRKVLSMELVPPNREKWLVDWRWQKSLLKKESLSQSLSHLHFLLWLSRINQSLTGADLDFHFFRRDFYHLRWT